MKLFEAAGKPVVGTFSFEICGFWADETCIWFIDAGNTLYKHDKQNNKTKSVGMIHGQKTWANVTIAENKKKLYFAPVLNDKISIFDMDKNTFERIDFKNDCNVARNFQEVISFKDFVYFIPSEFPAIMRLNTNTNEIEYFSEWVNEVSKLQTSKLQGLKQIFFGFCIVDMEIAMVINGTNAIMFFNMETGRYEVKHIGEKSEQYGCICFDGQNYYLSSFHEAYIVKWNRLSNKTSKIKLPASFSRKADISNNFSVLYSNEHICLFPFIANNAYKINAETNEVTEWSELTEFTGGKNLAWHYNAPFVYGNFIYAFTINNGIAEYNTNTGELNSIKYFKDEAVLTFWLCNGKFEEAVTEKTKNAGKTIWGYFK